MAHRHRHRDRSAPEPRVDPRGEPFLGTRFAAPARPLTFLRRARLADRLDQGLGTPLTLVDGPAGAGKTLLVADWAARLDRPVAWLTADPADRAPGLFWAYLLQALRVAGLRPAPGIGSPAHPSSVDRALLARLAADLSGRPEPAIVVVDEFERVPTADIAEQLEFVLHHASAGLRLILVTRSEPLLPLHRHRAAGSITEIRGAELAFTPEEAAALLAAHGLRLSADAAHTLVRRTRGWAAGLRLCALAARQSADPERCLKEFEAGHSVVADYLLAEVLRRQPAGTQDLLLRVSVVERFRPGLADALTGRSDAERILARLRRENAFVEPLGQTWYRLHPLFAEILRAHLRERHPGLETELHRRAARWLSRSGSLTETLAHGCAAGDWEFAARALVDDLAIGRLFTGQGPDDLGTPFARMTAGTDSPARQLVLAARELAGRDLGHGLPRLRHAEELLADDTADHVPDRLGCALLEALAARLTGSPGRAERAAGRARDLSRSVPAERLDRHPELLALLLAHVGSARLWAGHVAEARAALAEAVTRPGGAATALPRQDALGHLALIDWLAGRTAGAERKALAALREADRYGLPAPARSAVAGLVLAAVAVERDELDAAQALLDRVTADGHGTADPVAAAARALAGAHLLLARGDPGAAVAAVEDRGTAVVASPWAADHAALVASAARLAGGDPEAAAKALEPVARRLPACAVAAARARLAAGDTGTALGLLDTLPTPGPGGPALTVRAALVRAEAADRTGDIAAARRLVARALCDARRERLRRPFREAGPWLRPLLATAPAHDWLVAGGGTRDATGLRPAPVVEELSPRERDVLCRLAQLMSTEEIAADLYVSVNTVKTHLKGLYRKLSVGRRADAVRRARELRLL
ncbi:LuxR C-terminal-related transcriptional regulator [Streptomyces shenzhenensis]|uniref:Helix-turn-helix transcriptional regulator n=1 Tax=Streptomyces shenzhenensis TaxID=943815 RepID=A0A3M0I112_9ACTN|nr:LuxR C-terminal-related transcriptional regulator [Streptomyces shenzhenensis]RMB80423.1 helix-turn-helix transcriptional regulator [Streptomyces shenzhenensis]